MTENKDAKAINLEIQMDDVTALGQYVNMVVAQHSHSEFVLDFIFIQPGGQLKGRVRSRIILAPEHAKRLLRVLQDNIGRYEQRFGEIRIPELPPGATMPPASSVQ